MNILFLIILLLVILLIIILFYFYKKKNIEFFKESNKNYKKKKNKINTKKDIDNKKILYDVENMLSRKYLKEVNKQKVNLATLARLLSNNNYFIQ